MNLPIYSPESLPSSDIRRLRKLHGVDFTIHLPEEPLYSGKVPINERLKFAEQHNLSIVIEVKTSASLKESVIRRATWKGAFEWLK